ncbi:PREDICTED: uncharacterized protein LOC109326341 [Lupinus angustifolius]|uniref:uncharacterized protein LOC109326341 n=1 Tax=Lupinus angustifolius TaxID=3871 RepID=UPI00092E3D74|nr:PREDICTED: uncharacterized protein LOC109326341 [Lupinus angustifolius]
MQAIQVWHLEKTKKVIVELNGYGQGNDNGSNLLVRFLGKLAQNSTICPIYVKRWDWMSKDNRYQQWKYIEENFEFDYVAGVKWAMSTLGERWRAYKYRLRCKYFYPNKSKEDILANPPPGLDCADWTAFVHHYKEDKMKKQSLANTRSRKNLKVSHAGGSMSNARRGRQMELKLQRPVCRGEVVLSTLLKKDGSYVSEEGKTLALSVSSKVFAHPNDAIGKAYGAKHSGRVHGLGTGICPSSVFGTSRHFTDFVNSSGSGQHVEDLKKYVQTLEVKLSRYEETKEQLAHTQNRLATLEKFLAEKSGSELTTFVHDVPPSCLHYSSTMCLSPSILTVLSSSSAFDGPCPTKTPFIFLYLNLAFGLRVNYQLVLISIVGVAEAIIMQR